MTALAIAEAQHHAGWDVRLLLSGVRSHELLPTVPTPEPLLGEFSADVYRDIASIDQVAVALDRMTTVGDTIVSHEGIDLAAANRLWNRTVVAAVHSNPADCLAYLPATDLDTVRRSTDHWIAWGARVADQLVTSFGVHPRRITISGQAVSPHRQAAQSMTGEPACVSIARIHPVKNHTLMLQTLAVLAPSLPGLHWHMVGACDDDDYLRDLRRTAARLGVSQLVTWHGYRADTEAILQGSDVAVLSSHSEGVPRAIQEAMVLGVPTVMPAALARDLSHAGLPIQYCPQEPQVLAEAIIAALQVDAGRLVTAARWVKRRWGWASVLADWECAVGLAGRQVARRGPRTARRSLR